MLRIKDKNIQDLLYFVLRGVVTDINSNNYFGIENNKLDKIKIDDLKNIFNVTGIEYLELEEIKDILEVGKTFRIKLYNNKYYELVFSLESDDTLRYSVIDY